MENRRAGPVVRGLGVCVMLLTGLVAAAQPHPACMRVLRTVDAEVVPRAQELARERNQLFAAVPQVLGGNALLVPAGRATARAFIDTVERTTDDEHQLWVRHQTAMREGLQRELESDAAVAACISDYELDLATTEPPRLRLYEATQQFVRAALASVDAIEGILAAIDEFGSSGRVPRTDPRYVALVAAIGRLQATVAEAAQADDAYAAVYRTRQRRASH